MLSDYLTHEGYETIVAADGAEALALAAVQLLKFCPFPFAGIG